MGCRLMWQRAARGFFPKLAAMSCDRPWSVVMLSVLLVIASLLFPIANFDMTADSDALISPKVPWQLNEQRVDEAFPSNSDAIQHISLECELRSGMHPSLSASTNAECEPSISRLPSGRGSSRHRLR